MSGQRIGLSIALLLVSLPAGPAKAPSVWTQDTFLEFIEGSFDDGGANTYIAADGSLQLVHRWDLNNDGFLDPVFPSSHDNNYGVPSYIYWGGSRAQRTSLPGNGSHGQTIADLNRDGFPDIVLASEFNGTKTELRSFIYWGGKEGFSPNRRTGLPTVAATAVAAADLNGDGYPELVFASSGRSYQFEKLGGDFTFLRPVSDIYWGSAEGYSPKRVLQLTTHHATDIKIADLNQDGAPDLVFANFGQTPANAGVLIYWGPTYSKDRSHFLPALSAAAVALADLNGDGFIDIAKATERRPVESIEFAPSDDLPVPSFIFWGSREGFDGKRRTELPSYAARDVKAADLNHDGRPDLIYANQRADSLIYWNSADGFRPERRTALAGRNASRCAVADVNGDGRPDLVFAIEDNGRTTETSSVVYWNSTAGFSEQRKTELPTMGAVDAGVADFNRDGKPDVLFVNGRDGTAGQPVDMQLYWGGVQGYSAARRLTLPGEGLTAYTTADLNSDGWPELIAVGKELRIFQGSPVPFQIARSFTLPVHYAFSVGVADFNRDGYLDLSVADWGTGDPKQDRTLVYWGGPSGFSAGNQFRFPVPGARTHALADLDRNGYPDLIFTGTYGETLIFWNSPRGFDVERKTSLPSKLAVAAEVADLNHDGYLDIIVCNLYDYDKLEFPTVFPAIDAPPQTKPFEAGTDIFWGGPDGYSAQRRLTLPTTGGEDAAVADLNRDGYLDLVVTSYHAGVTRNHPSYIFWGSAGGIDPQKVTLLPTESASGVIASDFNRDDWPDILFSCHTQGTNHRNDSFLYWGGPEGFSEKRRALLPAKGPHFLTLEDPGHIATRKPEFTYTSKPFDAGGTVRLGRLLWQGTTPHRAALRFQVRSAPDRESLLRAAWQGPSGPDSFYTASGIVLGREGRWIQYKVMLTSPGGANSPVLRSVTLEYEK